MQQKSTQKILLFSVAAQKVEKIKALCKTLGISVQQVEKSDYGQKLGAIAGITGFKKDGSRYSGADFPGSFWSFQVLIHHKWISFWRNIRRLASNQSDVRPSWHRIMYFGAQISCFGRYLKSTCLWAGKL